VRLCAISVDLDEIPNYFAIHGQRPPVDHPALRAVYQRALSRIGAWASSFNIPLTLFTVASDLKLDANARAMASWLAHGHELGNHSLDHLYNLIRQPDTVLRQQIAGAQTLFDKQLGVRPTGFRAPGYAINDRMFAILKELGFTYDSSVFPCPAYYLSKSSIMLMMQPLGRMSQAIFTDPLALVAPRRPYRIGKRYWKKGSGLLEIPIQVTPKLRLPLIGTLITTINRTLLSAMLSSVVGEPLVNIELHGIDFLDANDDLRDLSQHQPDLRVLWPEKHKRLSMVADYFREQDYSFVTLNDAAHLLSV
jgi:peptidoglycan-N-acetylglucosamine deacetylase